MEKQELIEKIVAALAEEFEVEESDIVPEASVKDTLELDSLSLVDLVALLDTSFGVKVKGTDLAGIQNFQGLYDLVYERMEK